MNSLILFCVGLVSAVVLLPILQCLCDLVCTACELLKSYLAVTITKNNAEIQHIQDSLVPESTHAIGFEIPSEDDYYEDDEEDKCVSKSRQIGFGVKNGY